GFRRESFSSRAHRGCQRASARTTDRRRPSRGAAGSPIGSCQEYGTNNASRLLCDLWWPIICKDNDECCDRAKDERYEEPRQPTSAFRLSEAGVDKGERAPTDRVARTNLNDIHRITLAP